MKINRGIYKGIEEEDGINQVGYKNECLFLFTIYMDLTLYILGYKMCEITVSWKDRYIAKNGDAAYTKRLERRRERGEELPGGEKQRSQGRRDADPEKWREYDRAWRERNPQKVKEKGHKVSRKGGAYYEKKKIYKQTGISGERERVRMRDSYRWRLYKHIIAPNSQLHHQWILETADYTGLALVEANPHKYGIIDVIEILNGKITIFTE